MVQKHMFHQDDLRSVLIGGWTMSSVETDSAATTEGWAAYVGAVAWYDPQNTSGVAPLYGGMNIEAEGALNCGQNRSVPGQVARAFWDYDDATNEPSSLGVYPDASSKNTAWMARVWDLFPDGTGDDQDYESGDHGVNVQDYRGWAELTYDSFYTLISHNDLACQEPD